MANGLIDPVFEIRPNKLDFIRRSSDPQGTLGSLVLSRGHLAASGKVVRLTRSLLVSRGHLAFGGKVIQIRRRFPILRGHLTTQGKSIQFANAAWSTMPDLVVDRSTPPAYPHFAPGIRLNWLIDPLASVPPGNISVIGIDLAGVTYDVGNDRIAIASNPGVDRNDVIELQAQTAGGAIALSNVFTLWIKALAGFPAAAIALVDSNGTPTGAYGPSDDPGGAFFGQTGFAAADKWWAEGAPQGVTVTPLAGGTYTISASSGMAPGTYGFDAVRWTAATTAIARTPIPFTVT